MFIDGCNNVVWIGMVMGDTQHNISIECSVVVPCNACAYAKSKAGFGCSASGGVGHNIGDIG